jgi:hypothetical protein
MFGGGVGTTILGGAELGLGGVESVAGAMGWFFSEVILSYSAFRPKVERRMSLFARVRLGGPGPSQNKNNGPWRGKFVWPYRLERGGGRSYGGWPPAPGRRKKGSFMAHCFAGR